MASVTRTTALFTDRLTVVHLQLRPDRVATQRPVIRRGRVGDQGGCDDGSGDTGRPDLDLGICGRGVSLQLMSAVDSCESDASAKPDSRRLSSHESSRHRAIIAAMTEDAGVPSASRETPPNEINRLTSGERLIVLGLTLVAGVACFYDLGSRSMWIDEVFSALVAGSHGVSVGTAVQVDGGNQLGYYALLHAFAVIFGNHPFVLRAPSALAGTATVPVIFMLARRLIGLRAAVVAGTMIAFSSPIVVWSQQARGYALGTLLISASFLALVRALGSPNRTAWACYLVLVVLASYTLVLTVLYVAAQLVILAVTLKGSSRIRSVLGVVCVTIGAYLPLTFLSFRHHANELITWAQPPSTTEATRLVAELASGVAPDFFGSSWETAALTVVGIACWVVASAELLHRSRSSESSREGLLLTVGLSWLLVPVFLDILVSLSYQSIFDTSFLIPSVPASALLVAFCVGHMLPRRLGTVMLVGLATVLILELLPTYGVSEEGWAQATRYLASSSQSGDCITFNHAQEASDVEYYAQVEGTTRPLPEPVLPSLSWTASLRPTFAPPIGNQSFAKAESECGRLWLLINRPTPGNLIFVQGEVGYFEGRGWSEESVERFTGIDLYLFRPRTKSRG